MVFKDTEPASNLGAAKKYVFFISVKQQLEEYIFNSCITKTRAVQICG